MIAAEQYEQLTELLTKIVERQELHGRWHEAIHTLRMGLKMTRGAKHNRLYEAQLQTRLAGLLWKQGEFGTAMALLRQAKTTAAHIGDKATLALVLYHLGEVHYVKCFAMLVGHHFQAVDYHKQALQLREAWGDWHGVVQSLGRLGMIYEQLGDETQAAAYYGRAIQLAERLDDQLGLTRPVAQLGLYHQRRGEWCQAQRYAQYVLIVRNERQDQEGLIFALHHMALVTQARQRDYARALGYAQQALAIAEELDFKLAIAQTLFLIGQLHEMNCAKAAAAEYFLQAAALADEYYFEAISRPALTKVATLGLATDCVN